jgi:hypothetical protein
MTALVLIVVAVAVRKIAQVAPRGTLIAVEICGS